MRGNLDWSIVCIMLLTSIASSMNKPITLVFLIFEESLLVYCVMHIIVYFEVDGYYNNIMIGYGYQTPMACT